MAHPYFHVFLKIWTVCVLVFVNLLNYMDRYTIAGILPEIQNRTRNGFGKGVNNTEGGFLQTSFILTFMLLSIPFGYLGDRYTRKYIMAFGIFFWSVFVLAGSFSVDYWMLLGTRALVGVGEASYATIAPTIIADLFKAKNRLIILAIFYMAIPIGSALGYTIGSNVSDHVFKYYGVNDSWKWALRVTPGLGLLAVFLIIFTIREPPRGQSEDPRNTGGMKGKTGVRAYLEDLKYLLKNKTFILTTLGYAALTFAIGALAQWAPTLVYHVSRLLFASDLSKAYSDSSASSKFGIVTVLAGLVGTLSGTAISRILGRWTRQADSIVCAIGLMVAAPLLVIALSLAKYNLYAGWVLVFTSEFFLCLPWAPVGAILLYVVVPERRSTASALQILIIHTLGDAISPTIVGSLTDVFTKYLGHSHDSIYSAAVGMQYALYCTAYVCAVGGGFFLMSTLTVQKDWKLVEDHVKTANSRSALPEGDEASLKSNGFATPIDVGDDLHARHNIINSKDDEKAPLLPQSFASDHSINT